MLNITEKYINYLITYKIKQMYLLTEIIQNYKLI